MSGAEFKRLRELLGYSASEVASYLQTLGAPIVTERSVYRLQQRSTVPERYVAALCELAGLEAFTRATASIAPAQLEEPVRDRAVRIVSEVRKRPRASLPEPIGTDQFIRFLNALPTAARLTEWINLFREALRDFLGDVDRVTVNVNYMCDLGDATPGIPSLVMTEHLGPDGGRSVVRVQPQSGDQSPTERLLEQFKSNGYDLSVYWEPVSQDYQYRDSYLGSIILWRGRDRRRISQGTEVLLRSLEPFIVFALTDAIARHHRATPFDRAFDDALAHLRRDANLTETESRTLVFLLLGHSYKQIAAAIPISLDAVRKQIGSIYRKTGTRSSAELFAKYFTHRRVL
jgi:DNA-binding CsgD family transcriptional regulator